MMKVRSGFTLIELLVVIAIIAILASILLPVFAQAREKARSITCESNLKQVGTAVLMYKTDYDGVYPGISELGNYKGSSGCSDVWLKDHPNGEGCGFFWYENRWDWGGDNAPWDTMLYPYIKNAGVFKCPDDGDSDPAINPQYGPAPNGEGHVRSLSQNIDWRDYCGPGGLAGGDKTDPDQQACRGDVMSPVGRNEAVVPAPATTIYLTERYDPGCNVTGTDWCSDVWAFGGMDQREGIPRGAPPDQHSGGSSNYVFCDGHVHPYKIEQTLFDHLAGVHTPHDLVDRPNPQWDCQGLDTSPNHDRLGNQGVWIPHPALCDGSGNPLYDGQGFWDVRQQ